MKRKLKQYSRCMIDFTDEYGADFNQEILLAEKGTGKDSTYHEIMDSAESVAGARSSITSMIEIGGGETLDDHGKRINGLPLSANIIYTGLSKILLA